MPSAFGETSSDPSAPLIQIRAIAEAIVLLAKADHVDAKKIFGQTTDMNRLAAAYLNNQDEQLRRAAEIVRTWNNLPEKTRKRYSDLFRVWKVQQ